MSAELCPICKEADGKLEYKDYYASYYGNKTSDMYMCSAKCWNKFYYKKRCALCLYWDDDAVIFNGRAYCTSSAYWDGSCIESVQDQENNICSFCKRTIPEDSRGRLDEGFWCEKCIDLKHKSRESDLARRVLTCLRKLTCYNCGTISEKTDRVYLTKGEYVILKCSTCVESSKQVMKELIEKIGTDDFERIIEFGQTHGNDWKKLIENE
jgi:hypothetical protein